MVWTIPTHLLKPVQIDQSFTENREMCMQRDESTMLKCNVPLFPKRTFLTVNSVNSQPPLRHKSVMLRDIMLIIPTGTFFMITIPDYFISARIPSWIYLSL